MNKPKKRIRDRILWLLKYIFLGCCVFIALFPIVWVIFSSFKTNAEILSSGISLPQNFSFTGYKDALSISPILKYFGNSVIITVCATALNVLFLAMAAYVFARTRFRGAQYTLFYTIADNGNSYDGIAASGLQCDSDAWIV